MIRFSRIVAVVLLLAFGPGGGSVVAQTYPSKPVRIVVPFSPGGTIDIMARLIGQKLTEAWNQPVLVENRGGSGGRIGAEVVAHAPADGHTLLFATSGLAMTPSLYRKSRFDARKDFAPITEVCSSHLTLVSNSSVPAASGSELVALAKSRPGVLNYGHTGVGSNQQLTMELLKSWARVDIQGIAYKGASLVSNAVGTGEVDVAFIPAEMALGFIKAGKLRALAITSKVRSQQLPDIPTMEEAGLRDFGVPGWNGLLAPAGTPRAIVDQIQRDTAKALSIPDVRDRILGLGLLPVGSTPAEFEAKYREDLVTYARIVSDMRIPLSD